MPHIPRYHGPCHTSCSWAVVDYTPAPCSLFLGGFVLHLRSSCLHVVSALPTLFFLVWRGVEAKDETGQTSIVMVGFHYFLKTFLFKM